MSKCLTCIHYRLKCAKSMKYNKCNQYAPDTMTLVAQASAKQLFYSLTNPKK